MEMQLRRTQRTAMSSRPATARPSVQILPSPSLPCISHRRTSAHLSLPAHGDASTSTPRRPCRASSSNGSSHKSTSPTAPASASDAPLPGFDSIPDALASLAAGKFVVVLDDEDRENEGDLIIPAARMTTADMAFLVEHSSGVVCIAMEGPDLDRLRLPLMISSAENEESMYTAFTVTCDLRNGTSTGISASDRAATVRALGDPAARHEQFRRPGHIFPLRYRPGGVLTRPGHTEAGVDLARLAGFTPMGVLCEIVSKEDGSMARAPELHRFAKEHQLKIITIADLVRHIKRHGMPNGQAQKLAVAA